MAFVAVALVHRPLFTLAAASFSKRFTRSAFDIDIVLVLVFVLVLVLVFVVVAFRFLARRFGLGVDELSEGYSDAVA